MGSHVVAFAETGEHLSCAEGRSLLESMERLQRKGIPVGCRNGGCGVCKIQVLEGRFDRRAMSRAHVAIDEEADGMALACRVYPTSDMTVSVVGKMRRAFADTQTTNIKTREGN